MENNETLQPDSADTQPAEQQDRTAGANDAPLNLTQAQLDAIIANQKAEVRRRLEREYGDLDELKTAKQLLDERQQAELSEMQKLQQRLDALEREKAEALQQAEAERLNTLRLRVGQEAGLPPVLAARLQGADEDSLKADAEAVRAVLGGSAPAALIPDINATAGAGTSTSGRGARLSDSQKAAADKAGIPHDEYAKLLRDMES